MSKYNPNGILLHEWALVNAPLNSAGGGFAIICNDIYYDRGVSGLYHGTLGEDTIVFSTLASFNITPADFAACIRGIVAPSGGKDTSFALYRGCKSGTVNFHVPQIRLVGLLG